MTDHPMPSSPDRPDAPTVLEAQTERLARALSRNDTSLLPVNRMISRHIVTHVLRDVSPLPKAFQIIDEFCHDRPAEVRLVAQRLRRAARLVEPRLRQQVVATGYRRNPIDLETYK